MISNTHGINVLVGLFAGFAARKRIDLQVEFAKRSIASLVARRLLV